MDETKRSKQEALDKRYIRMASIWAENSYCQRRQVGALIVKDKMIISDGYNGTPSGFENVCEDENNLTKPYVLHAEANAITKIARSNNSSNGATMYVTASPCIECAKLIIQAGIKRVVYSEKYRLEDGIELLKRAVCEGKKTEGTSWTDLSEEDALFGSGGLGLGGSLFETDRTRLWCLLVPQREEVPALLLDKINKITITGRDVSASGQV
jgi:dCMP deaminase